MILIIICIISIILNIGFVYILVIQSLNYESTLNIVESYDLQIKSMVGYIDFMDSVLKEHPYQLDNVIDSNTLEYFQILHTMRDELKSVLET